MAARTRLNELIVGFQASQAIHVAVTLGIADLLAAGPRSSSELAAATRAHADALYRVLRALAGLGVLHEDTERRFSLTPMGTQLRSDVDGGVGPFAALMYAPSLWQAWGDLPHAVRAGGTAFEHVHGASVWQYRVQHPEASALFDRAMAARTSQQAQAALRAYDFGRFAHVVDVGGGDGTLLGAILSAHPHVRGTLLDRPPTAARASASLAARGLGGRFVALGGSFFDSVPEGGDAYVLKYILHDWDDAEATAILRTCRRAMAPGALLIVLERVIGPPNTGALDKLSDLHMMAITGGRERTAEEFAGILGAAGFALKSIAPTASPLRVIEAAPAG
jgi:hypothetical protein